MPTLDWIGKDKVINHHKDVPYKVLERKYSFDESGMHKEDIHSNNMIIHGDNLEALKSLLPQYEGKIKCIYIDPPYNTGNEGWIYNDNVNDPKIKKWLGEVVGKEGEDLSRHDKWLCMMYPRLVLLQKLLADDGAIFISIDDNEKDYLKLICNEIFGANYYMGTIVRATGQTTGQDSSGLGSSFDYVLVYSKSCDYIFGGLPLTEHDLKRFKNEDDRGNYAYDQLRKTGSNDRREDRPNMYYAIINPDGEELYPTATAGYDSRWRVEKKTYNKLVEDDLIFWKKTKRNNEEVWWPYVKYYAEGRTKRPSPLWTEIEGNKKASRDVKSILGVDCKFDYPKPIEMIDRILKIASVGKEDIVLDSFAGSGTTAHAVLNMNKSDGGNRRFILVEMGDYADTITAERVKRVINGYGEGKNAVEGTGGNFSYYELGNPLFMQDGTINDEVDITEVRKYVWYTETNGIEYKEDIQEKYFLGSYNDTAYYFYYEKDRVTILDYEFLTSVHKKEQAYVIYADSCALSDSDLQKWNITFKKIPRDIEHI